MGDMSINAVLKDMRKEHDLTQEELAKKMGVTRDMVARMDSDMQKVKFEYLINFSKALGVSTTDIMDRFERGPSFAYLLRAAHGSYFTDSLRFRYEKWYRRMEKTKESITLPCLREIPDRDEHLSPDASVEEKGVAAAKWLRKKWKLGNNPIADPVDLIESLGYFIIGADLGNTKLFAVTGKKKGTDIPGVVINTNRNISIERQRYSVIHELGHILEHGRVFDVIPDSSGQGRNKDIRDKFADAFAGEFLVPGEELKRLYQRVFIKNFDNKLIYLKNHFKVSYECIITRLFLNGLLNMDRKAFGAFLAKKRMQFGNKEPMPIKTLLSFNQEKQLIEMIRREKEDLNVNYNPSIPSPRISLASS